MSHDEILHRAARRSLLSVLVTAGFITVNHLYPLGAKALLLGALLAGGATALLWWFRNSRSSVAFAGYLLMNLWIVVGFGLLKGFWADTLPVFIGSLLASLSTSFARPTLAPVWVELSGIAMFIGSLFVLYNALALIRARRESLGGAPLALPGRAFALAFVAIAAAYAVVDRDRWVAPPNGVVKIGVIVPLTGPYTILGNSFLKAVEMAERDLRGTKYRYQLVRVDVGQDPRQAGAAIGHAIQDEKVNAIVGGISLFGQVTQPIATAARIPHTCVCTVTSIGDGAYNFTNIPTPEAEARLWVQEARRRGVRQFALLSQNYPSIHNHVKALKAEAARVGLPISYETEFSDSVRDFRGLIEAARASHADVYYVEALSPQRDILGRQLKETNIRNIASVVAPSLSEHPEVFEGAWYTDSDLHDIGFRRRFEEQYPATRFATHMMPYAYDDFNMIVQAYERGENPAVYLRNLAAYPGTAGPLTKQRGRGNFQSTPAVWTIRDGRPTLNAN